MRLMQEAEDVPPGGAGFVSGGAVINGGRRNSRKKKRTTLSDDEAAAIGLVISAIQLSICVALVPLRICLESVS